MSSSTSGQPAHREWIRHARLQSDEADLAAAGTLSAADAVEATLLAPDYFPGYELQREIHRGAQGIVFRAVQLSTRRPVALKVLRDGPFTGAADRARFEREVQTLAQLRHPDIVAIHDSGQVAGHFFLVMDLIDGRPLDPRASADRSVRETLPLFGRICEAVSAAHLRGVMHRDLKPGNILVDSDGAPHILDFGLAKFTEERAGDNSAVAATRTGQFVGSLPWCSPEQAAGASIDTRTDVYSLGVLMYQMLTGRFPYPVVGPADQVLSAIRTGTPARPRGLRRDIDDEVETIVLKCLQKEPARRYQSAGELARDLRRYLAGEPIEAKRDSAAYVLRKSLQRHRLATGVASAFVLVIIVGLAASLTLWRAAARQRDLALEAGRQQQIERARAEAESRKLRNVNHFVQNMLASADPGQLHGPDVSARTLLDNAAQEIDGGALRDQPEAAAAVRLTLGRAYTTLGAYQAAEQHLSESLRIRESLTPVDEPSTGEVYLAIARLRLATFESESAESAARRALATFRAAPGDRGADLAAAWDALSDALLGARRFDESVAAMRESVAAWRAVRGEHPDLAYSLAKLALRMHGADESETLLEEALRLVENSGAVRSVRYGRLLSVLARTQHMRRDYAAAVRTYLRANDVFREALTSPNQPLLNNLEDLVLLHQQAGNWPAALETANELLRGARTLEGDDSLRVAITLIPISSIQAKLEQYEQGASAAREALSILKRRGEDQTFHGAEARAIVGNLALKLGKLDVAEEAARDCLAIPDGALDGMTWRKSLAKSLLGEILTRKGQFDAAEPLLTSAYAELVESHIRAELLDQALRRVVALYEAWGNAALAEEWRKKLASASP